MSVEKTSAFKRLLGKLRNKYRLVVLNDETFEEKLSLKLSRLNVFFVVGFLMIFLIISTTLLIAFTPLREYIPGYSSTALRRKAFELALRTDSLQNQINYNERYLLNIRRIVEGKPQVNFSDTAVSDSVVQAELNQRIDKEDSMLRAFVEEEERFNITQLKENGGGFRLSFFAPIKGLITNSFNAADGHLGVDLVANKNEVVKAVQDGIVIFSGWTAETGYVLILQHPGELISAYKHNSSLIKESGQPVKAGEPIAIIGDSGELTTGPHLHFELWYQGNPVDPENYISF